jgi:hypothetical protein
MKTTTFPVNGLPREAVELNFETVKEPWLEMKIEDGAVIKMRLSIEKILRVDSIRQADGGPTYIVMAGANQIRVDVPEDVKTAWQPDPAPPQQ